MTSNFGPGIGKDYTQGMGLTSSPIMVGERGGGTRSLAVAVLALGLLLLALVGVLAWFSPLHLEPALLAVSIVLGGVFSLTLMAIGRFGLPADPAPLYRDRLAKTREVFWHEPKAYP